MGYSSSDTVSGAISGVNNNGSMDHGWAAYLTLWSAQSTLKSDGTPKINLNQPDMQTLYTQLTPCSTRRGPNSSSPTGKAAALRMVGEASTRPSSAQPATPSAALWTWSAPQTFSWCPPVEEMLLVEEVRPVDEVGPVEQVGRAEEVEPVEEAQSVEAALLADAYPCKIPLPPIPRP